MQFEVPQFIDVEDKIFGPLTFKQFVFLAGGGGACFALYSFLPFLAAVPLIIAIGGLSIALAFYKVNNRPFTIILQAALKHSFSSKLYIWQRPERKEQKEEAVIEDIVVQGARQEALQASKLRDLGWALDLRDRERQNQL